MAKDEKVTKSVIPREKAATYKVSTKVKTAGGRNSIDSDDAVAKKLRGKDMKELAAIAKEAGVDIKRWAHLNVGMQRMNLGNALRTLARQAKKPAKKKAA